MKNYKSFFAALRLHDPDGYAACRALYIARPEYKDENKQRVNTWREKNRERYNAYQRQYYQRISNAR